MKFNKKLKEAPLGYWEKESYMLVIPEEVNKNLLEGIFERINTIDNVNIIEKRILKENEPGMVKLNYKNEEYEITFYPTKFSLPEMYTKNYYFSKEEIEKLKNTKSALTICMKFNDDVKKSYQLQLKLALAMIPNMIGVMDESAEKMMPASWVKMTANSKYLPSSNALFTVQAVSADNGEIWLHTHGLCRCGITELEILQSNKENYNNHYNVITTFAGYLIDKKSQYKNSAYIGILSNRQPIVVTYISWTEALKEYRSLDLGSVIDRQNSHNSRTSIIFVYKTEKDEKKGKVTKVSEFDKLWGDNPIFFISNEETKRMKNVAMERFNFVKDAAKKKENKIFIKIGIPINQSDELEHIWFELIEFQGDNFKARLLQEPYNVENIHEGDERIYTVQDVTDWSINTPDFTVTPESVYLLK